MKFAQAIRVESWGIISYDRERDEFSAFAHTGAKIFPGAPLGVGWVLTGACNLRCIHCYGNAEALPRGHLDQKDCIRVVDALVAAGVMRVVISGGEPLIHPAVLEIVQSLAARGVSVVLGTNGSLVTPRIASGLTACNRVEISLDGSCPEIHDAIRPSRRPGKSSWREAVRGIRTCLDAGLSVRVLTTINSINEKNLVTLGRVIHDLGVTDWAVSYTLRAGRALPIYGALYPDKDIVLEQVRCIQNEYPFDFRFSDRSIGYNRYYCLILPDGKLATEDLEAGTKITFVSAVEHPISSVWSTENFDILGHFDKWVGNRVTRGAVFTSPNVRFSLPRYKGTASRAEDFTVRLSSIEIHED